MALTSAGLCLMYHQPPGQDMGPWGTARGAWWSPRFCGAPAALPGPAGAAGRWGLSAPVGPGEFGLREFSADFSLRLVSVQTGLKPKCFLNFLQIGSCSRPAAPAGPLLPRLPARAIGRNVPPQTPKAACPRCCSPGLPCMGPQQPPPWRAMPCRSSITAPARAAWGFLHPRPCQSGH